MDLTAEALMEVLRSLRSDSGTALMRRRRLPRVGVRLRMTILPCLDEGAVGRSALVPAAAAVRLRNISRRGLGFLHDHPLAIGQVFIITLPRESGGTVQMLGRVERCRQLDAATWDVGGSIRLDVPREEIEFYVRGGGDGASAQRKSA